jgi:hypothetical protein
MGLGCLSGLDAVAKVQASGKTARRSCSGLAGGFSIVIRFNNGGSVAMQGSKKSRIEGNLQIGQQIIKSAKEILLTLSTNSSTFIAR